MFFLVLFLVMPVLGMLIHFWAGIERMEAKWLSLLMLIARGYMTPWDNYLVASRIWYYDPALVLGTTIGWGPVKEFAFFLLTNTLLVNAMSLLSTSLSQDRLTPLMRRLTTRLDPAGE